MKRRNLIQASLALGGLGSLSALVGCAGMGPLPSKAKVLVVGGGYGGATAAKYVRMLSNYSIDVVLVEPNSAFVSCPISNLVLGGSKSMADITTPYDNLSRKHGVHVARDTVTALDPTKKTVTLAGGASIGYDKLILSPGIDMMWNSIEGAQAAHTSGQVLHAWKAGAETLALRKQLEAMLDGGVYALTLALPEANPNLSAAVVRRQLAELLGVAGAKLFEDPSAAEAQEQLLLEAAQGRKLLIFDNYETVLWRLGRDLADAPTSADVANPSDDQLPNPNLQSPISNPSAPRPMPSSAWQPGWQSPASTCCSPRASRRCNCRARRSTPAMIARRNWLAWIRPAPPICSGCTPANSMPTAPTSLRWWPRRSAIARWRFSWRRVAGATAISPRPSSCKTSPTS